MKDALTGRMKALVLLRKCVLGINKHSEIFHCRVCIFDFMLGSVLSRRLARAELFMGSRKLNQHKVLHEGNLTLLSNEMNK